MRYEIVKTHNTAQVNKAIPVAMVNEVAKTDQNKGTKIKPCSRTRDLIGQTPIT